VDSMLQKLEKYADNLENIVQHRTASLIDEKQKTDMLLHRMLPPYDRIFSVELMHGLSTIFFDCSKECISLEVDNCLLAKSLRPFI